jgi:hypothetical protein
MRSHSVWDSFNAVTSRSLRSLHVTSRFSVLAPQYTERIDVILHQNSTCNILLNYAGSANYEKFVLYPNTYRGNTTLSSALRKAWSLKFWNSTPRGGKRNGLFPKLKRHCWNDMKLAAANRPDLKWTHFNIILPSVPGSSKWSLSLRFHHKNPVNTSPLPQHISFFLLLSPK